MTAKARPCAARQLQSATRRHVDVPPCPAARDCPQLGTWHFLTLMLGGRCCRHRSTTAAPVRRRATSNTDTSEGRPWLVGASTRDMRGQWPAIGGDNLSTSISVPATGPSTACLERSTSTFLRRHEYLFILGPTQHRCVRSALPMLYAVPADTSFTIPPRLVAHSSAAAARFVGAQSVPVLQLSKASSALRRTLQGTLSGEQGVNMRCLVEGPCL